MTERPVRFEIERPLDFRFTDARSGARYQGRTVNISTNGVLFRTDTKVGLGRKMEIFVRMAKLSPDAVEVDLRLLGMSVRTGDGWAAVQVRKCQILPRGGRSKAAPGKPGETGSTGGKSPGPGA